MNRTRFIAIAIGLIAIGGLIAVNLGGSQDDDLATSSVAPLDDDQTDATVLSNGETEAVVDAPPVLGPAPDLVDLDGWLQTDATEFSSFDNQVRIVQFWTFGCINCKRTLPNLSALYAEYADDGLEIIGVHSPEFAFEEDPTAIQAAATDLDITWPIALDTEKTNFRSWQDGRRFWPRTYVIDRDGQIRFDHVGEGAYDELNAAVAYLIDHEE